MSFDTIKLTILKLKKDMSYVEFANEISKKTKKSVHPTTLQKVATGERMPSLDLLETIAEYAGIQLKDFFTIKEEPLETDIKHDTEFFDMINDYQKRISLLKQALIKYENNNDLKSKNKALLLRNKINEIESNLNHIQNLYNLKKQYDKTLKRINITEDYLKNCDEIITKIEEKIYKYAPEEKHSLVLEETEQYLDSLKKAEKDYKLKENILNTKEFLDVKNFKRVPVVGIIRAGEPILAQQNIVGYEYIPEELAVTGEFFGLKVVGDSMNLSRINDGDIVIVRQQPVVENGDTAVVLVDGENATIKKFYRTGELVTLLPHSTNPEHQPRIIDLSKTEIKVLGKVVKVIINL